MSGEASVNIRRLWWSSRRHTAHKGVYEKSLSFFYLSLSQSSIEQEEEEDEDEEEEDGDREDKGFSRASLQEQQDRNGSNSSSSMSIIANKLSCTGSCRKQFIACRETSCSISVTSDFVWLPILDVLSDSWAT